ncbi:MAG: hypothetical protein JWM18_4473 [Chloroflexi bacterium]|nr:hypothetical protein [Chloroflexota bacterium]
MVAVSDRPPTVHWGCVSCEDDGVISGWKGTACDLSPDPADEEMTVAVVVSEDAHRALLGCLYLDRVCERVVHSAEPVRGGIELCATETGWEEFRDAVAAEANHASRPRQRRLDQVLRELEEALELTGRQPRPGAGCAAAPDIPELTRLAAERDVATYCELRVPLPARHQVRLELETRDGTLTIVERRVPFDAGGPVEPAAWTRAPVAQLRWSDAHVWRLYWRGRGRWHLDTGAQTTPDVAALIRRVTEDPALVYWG